MLKNYDKYKTTKNVLRKKLPGGGRKGKLLEYKKDLILWILEVRRGGYAVSIDAIIAYLYKKKWKFKNNTLCN